LANDVEGRTPMDVLQERLVDEGLVVAAAGLVDHGPKIL
jgi:hypothetical protein